MSPSSRCPCWPTVIAWLALWSAIIPAVAAADLDDAAAVEHFEKHVRPLLVAQCYGCHSERAEQREGGLLLDSRDGWRAGGDNGAAIVPGEPEQSLLIRAVRYDDPDLQMPPNRKLDPADVAALEEWVRQGAVDPRHGAAPRSHSNDDPSDPIAGRSHWAFRPLNSEMPPVLHEYLNEAAAWAWSPLDLYVGARRRHAQLGPAPDADRRTFARRLYYQLTGLPPTAAQLAAYLADERRDATTRLVDQLLASPEFGRRWGRHWLDLARYADSNGLDENFLFREAWRYRNWVIEAVNRDMPYDQFLIHQIAGDLLPFDSIRQRDQQRIAAGFLVVGPKVLLGNSPHERRMDVADEQLDTIGRAVLGQTIGCARCHDHKFDPIPTADYYALAGIFTSTEVMETRFMLGQQRNMERLVGLGPDGDTRDAAYEKYFREKPQLTQRRDRAKKALDLLEKIQAANAADAADAADEPASQPAEELAELAKRRPDAVAAPLDAEFAERIGAQRELVKSLAQQLAQPPEIPPRAMIPADGEPADEKIRIAGQFDQHGAVAPRGLLQVIGSDGYSIPADASGRLELSHWLSDTEHGAGELAARVLANRIWRHLIGAGLVGTMDNFGRTGASPTHPQLLDYLAEELIRDGWSVKRLVRKIVLSRTFAMSSAHDSSRHDIDPANHWLWRAHRRRLEPEAFRDTILQAAGQLDRNPMDSTVWYLGDQATAVGANKNRRRTDFPCRSVYLPVIRNDLPELFDVFDFADPQTATGARPATMVATQGLFILNDTLMIDASLAVARLAIEQVKDVDQAVEAPDRPEDERIAADLFRRILQRPATSEQAARIAAFVRESGDADAVEAWAMAAHALFASSQLQILE